MKRRDFLLGLTGALVGSRMARATVLSSGLQIPLPVLPTLGGASFNGTASGNGIIDPRNYLDQYLPDECPISKAIFWMDATPPTQTGGPIPANLAGNVTFGIDVGGAFVAAGWPKLQRFEPILVNTLVLGEIFAGGSRQKVENHIPPVDYRPNNGDLIILAPEIGVPSVPAALYGAFLGLEFALEGGLRDLPIPSYLFQSALDMPTNNNPGVCIANIIPGPPTNATSVRFHIDNLWNAPNECHWTNLSVGLQADNTSSMQAAPIPVNFATLPEFSRYPDTGIWSDWTPLSVPAGQNILLKTSLFRPGNVNSWCLNTISGLGAWVSFTDSWNSKDMAGALTWQPTRTHMVDKAQYR